MFNVFGKRQEFHLVSELHGKVVDIQGGTPEKHAKLIVRPKEKHAKNQLFYLDGEGCIRTVLGDFVIEAEGTGKQLRLTEHCGDQRHHWTHEGRQVINRGTGECMDIKEGWFHDDAEVVSNHYKDKNHQHWRMEYDE